MRKKDHKLYKTLMLSALAFMTLCSFKASALDMPVKQQAVTQVIIKSATLLND